MAIFSDKTEKADKESKKASKASAAGTLGKVSADLLGVLVKPRISEKSGKAVSLNKYVFVVARGANKISVKKAIEGTYKVKVTQVNMINTQGKSRNFGRTAGKTSGFKKAVVTLKEGDKIEGVTETV